MFSDGLDLQGLAITAIDPNKIAKPDFQIESPCQAASRMLPAHVETAPRRCCAFIVSFLDWLIKQENITVAKNPKGFGRCAFPETTNEKIIGIFSRNSYGQ